MYVLMREYNEEIEKNMVVKHSRSSAQGSLLWDYIIGSLSSSMPVMLSVLLVLCDKPTTKILLIHEILRSHYQLVSVVPLLK